MTAEPASPPGPDRPADALLDEAHRGDIEGAFGTIHLEDTGSRRTWKALSWLLVSSGFELPHVEANLELG